MVVGNVFACKVGAGNKAETRTTEVGEGILVYRNLNKPSFFSIKQTKGKYKVSGYANSIVIKNPDFKISEASRQRVLERKSCIVICWANLKVLKKEVSIYRQSLTL